MDQTTRQVLDAARYLRSVRAIDPAELTEYVSAGPSPERVRAILRTHAADLGLVETPTGSFEQPPDAPIEADPRPIEALPSSLNATLIAWLESTLGADWADGRTGGAIRDRIASMKAQYLRSETASYDDDIDTAAYLVYHFPRSYAATGYVLATLIDRALLGHDLRVLDVGAGVGAHLASIADATPPTALVRYDAVEPAALGSVLVHLADAYVGPNVHVTRHRQPIETLELEGPYDLIVLGNVLSELDAPVSVARSTLDRLAADGAWIAIAPADPRTSRQLAGVERELVPPATVFAPALRLWPDREPTDEHWSFVEAPPLETPPFQRRLVASVPEEERERYVNADVRFSYTVLRRDGRRRVAIRGDRDEQVPLEEAADAVGSRPTLLVVKLSGDIADGDNRLFRVGDGSQHHPWFASQVVDTALNRALSAAPHGAVLSIARGLVLWNDDEAAYHVVVDDETAVDVVAA